MWLSVVCLHYCIRGRLLLGRPIQASYSVAPPVVWVAPVAVGLVIGLALRVFAYSKGSGPEVTSPFGDRKPLLIAGVSALGFGIGVFFGPIAALVIFFLAPLAGHGFVSHISSVYLQGALLAL